MPNSDNRLTARQAGGHSFEILPSAARTATVTSIEFENIANRGLMLLIDVTAAAAGPPSVVASIRAYDYLTAKNFPVATFTAFTAVGQYVKMLYPAAVKTIAEANLEIQGLPFPAIYVVRLAHADTVSMTYSVTGHTLN